MTHQLLVYDFYYYRLSTFVFQLISSLRHDIFFFKYRNAFMFRKHEFLKNCILESRLLRISAHSMFRLILGTKSIGPNKRSRTARFSTNSAFLFERTNQPRAKTTLYRCSRSHQTNFSTNKLREKVFRNVFLVFFANAHAA